MHDKSILLIIGGGIAAYKSLELIRLLKKCGAIVRVILTKGGAEFVTPLSVSTLAGEKTFTDLFDLDDEAKIGHIKLARDADLIVVAPATADLMAKMANGLANDLATTCLLAANSPILIAPAMNPFMYEAMATKRNRTRLIEDGVHFAGPASGDMACGEDGEGRMLEPVLILDKIDALLNQKKIEGPKDLLLPGRSERSGELSLEGRHVLVTAGPTHEPIDPVRYIANHSSGKQGYAIAIAARDLGASVALISGPTSLPVPDGVQMVRVETAEQMLAAAQKSLPADVAVCAAAVGDWRVAQNAVQKIKKTSSKPPVLGLVENTDILKTLSRKGPSRPQLVIGFAAETQDLVENARKKLKAKGCDWIVANDVSAAAGTFGGNRNQVTLIIDNQVDKWPSLDKQQVAERLMLEAADRLANIKKAAE
ncbi:MAG: bifunctional phosphopantothenoylcysteine decarboxylase/phosphopantothenate--cysteine ligase CoaBC [bacterium]|nr:bifunctional phosphopantothenoylcysteine decarboxylase/phosphopantothenate--cysteine ligase CoaBC [bacterium]